MRDSIVKVRMTEQEKADLFEYSERNCATVSDLLRGASRDICAQQSIGRDTRKSLVALRKRALGPQADHLSALVMGEDAPPRAAFSHAQHQEAKREGVDLPALRAIIKEAWAGSANKAKLRLILAEAGLAISAGTRAGTWIVIDDSGTLVGALDRLAGIRKAAVRERLGDPSLMPPLLPSL